MNKAAIATTTKIWLTCTAVWWRPWQTSRAKKQKNVRNQEKKGGPNKQIVTSLEQYTREKKKKRDRKEKQVGAEQPHWGTSGSARTVCCRRTYILVHSFIFGCCCCFSWSKKKANVQTVSDQLPADLALFFPFAFIRDVITLSALRYFRSAQIRKSVNMFFFSFQSQKIRWTLNIFERLTEKLNARSKVLFVFFQGRLAMHNKKDGYKKLPKTDVMNVQSKKKKKIS